MRRIRSGYFAAGLAAGLLTVSMGSRAPIALTLGTGPIFALTIIGCIVLSNSQMHIDEPIIRYPLFLITCICTFVASMVGFSAAMGYAPDLAKVARSRDILDFKADVWIGLIVAVAIAAAGIELGARLLAGFWSNRMLLGFFIAGVGVIAVDYLCNSNWRGYWSLVGTMLPLGEGAFAALLCHQLLQSSPRDLKITEPPLKGPFWRK